ncbi:hypothetical protein BpHYR1_046333 [Brachionus plicatilis]|uniref:Uncharacterized protein n=1 Tax=Brachionus plicatilis TaxID=10195 RepID=A0A3M7PU04_BRAPC|nr:hypothetical protein BpHYR1_046333 [Brachionus plicatilis]
MHLMIQYASKQSKQLCSSAALEHFLGQLEVHDHDQMIKTCNEFSQKNLSLLSLALISLIFIRSYFIFDTFFLFNDLTLNKSKFMKNKVNLSKN